MIFQSFIKPLTIQQYQLLQNNIRKTLIFQRVTSGSEKNNWEALCQLLIIYWQDFTQAQTVITAHLLYWGWQWPGTDHDLISGEREWGGKKNQELLSSICEINQADFWNYPRKRLFVKGLQDCTMCGLQQEALCVTTGEVWVGRGGVVLLEGLMRFSFCLRLQNHTRITSFSMLSCSAKSRISSEVGFWFWGGNFEVNWTLVWMFDRNQSEWMHQKKLGCCQIGIICQILKPILTENITDNISN